MKYCPSCGTPNQDTSGFCAKCGTKLPQAPVQAPAQPPNAQQPGYPNAQQPGYPNAQQPGYPNAQQNGYPNAQQPGYPNAQQPGYPNAQQNGYPNAQQPGYPNAQQPGYPNAQQNGYPNAQQAGFPGAQPAGNAAAEPAKKKKEKKPKDKKDKKKSKAPWIAGGCVLLAAAGAVAGFFIWKGRQKDQKLTLEEFKFRQSAFECGQGDVSTLVMAVFDQNADTSGLKVTAKCRDTGDEIVLTDDGEGADTVAGDNVFYGMVTLSSDEERTLEYSLSVTGGKEFKSESASIRFFTMSAYDNEQDAIRSLRYEIDAIAETYLYQIGSPSEESADIYLKGAKEINKLLDEKQQEGTIVSYSFDAPYYLIQFPISSYAYCYGEFSDEQKVGGGDGTAGGIQEYILADADLSMMMLMPYNSQLNSSAFLAALSKVSDSDLGYQEAAELHEGDVDFDRMRNLESYRVIALNTHGGYDSTFGSFFAIGVPYNTIPAVDRANNNLIESSNGRALVTSNFFETYYEDGSLNDCLIYLGCCHGADSDRLARTLIRKGADAVLGYKNSVYEDYDNSMVQDFFADLIEKDSGADGQTHTVDTALRAAKDKNGAQDPTQSEWDVFWSKVRGKGGRAELTLFQRNSSDPFRLIKDTSSGTVGGSVLTARDGYTAIPNARITITDENGTHRSFFTDRDGQYAFSMPVGTYNIKVSAEGYLPLETQATVYPNYMTYLETILMIAHEENETTGIASGSITSAMTGYGLEGVRLTLRSNWANADQGEIAATLTTDSSGYYQVELPVGYYTVNAELDGYVTMSFNIVVQSGTTENQNATMNVELDGDQYRIVLTWDENPRDVDIHIRGPQYGGGTFHVYWDHMSYYEGDITVCNLDVDDRYSYGPETITLVTRQEDEPYYCYIHRYDGYGTLTSSGATVRVYTEAGLAATFTVPPNGGSGDYWNVFAIKNGRLVVNNSITGTPNTSYAE
ncbi:MAG: carboxypeptidase regulatory-like domain-containing protein [Oscillospiraceae bacterium]|nr:carboxypeptidase regulatory-like domain-containing protein [Oscillospiraceae bacterium]